MLKSFDDYYDIISKGYNELYGSEQLKKLEFIMHCIKKYPELNKFISKDYILLDVGCGTGISTDYFPAREKTGIDPSVSLIKIASDKHPRCRFFICDAESMEIKGFDILISLTAIQNFSGIEKGLQNIRKAAKKFILTYLKKSEKASIIEAYIENNFNIIKRFEEDKDIIFFCE